MGGDQKRIAQYGVGTAFKRTLPFNEAKTLKMILPYLLRNLGFVEGEVMTQEEAQVRVEAAGKDAAEWKGAAAAIESAEPGQPGFQFYHRID